MSYILDALRRSDQDRKKGDVPGLQSQPDALVRESSVPFKSDRKNVLLWQAYLWFDEFITMKIRHTNRIKAIKSGKSKMDANLEEILMGEINFDSLIELSAQKMEEAGKSNPIWEWTVAHKGINKRLAGRLVAQIDDIALFVLKYFLAGNVIST